MAFTYGFYNSLKGDRRYNAEQMSEIFDGILIDGIIPSIGQLFVVKTASNRMQITVGTGRAWFDHTWSKNDAVLLLIVPPCDVTRPRYDAVVLEVNHNERVNSIKIVKGVPAVNPLKPTLVNEDKVHQYPLAYILVRAGTSEIKAADIENTVGRSPTPFATGVLETAPLDDLWNQWKGEFTDWFDNIKAQLSGNIATNLQNQIDAVRASIPGKATNSEVLTGSNDSKFVTPAGLKNALNVDRRYITDSNGTTYTLRARDILPMLPRDSIDIDNESMAYGYFVKLANYEVLHYNNKVWVFDKAGSVRNYAVSCNLTRALVGWTSTSNVGPSITTPRAVAIRGTNKYIAFTDDTLYRITIGSSSPIVEVYYTWPSTDGTPKALSYINADWSALVLGFADHKFRVFKIPNAYISQPTIYTFEGLSEFGTSTSSTIKIYGMAGKQVIYASNNAYAIGNALTGEWIQKYTKFNPFIHFNYVCVDDLNGYFLLTANSASTESIQYVYCCKFSASRTDYTTSILNEISGVVYNMGTIYISSVNEERGWLYYTASRIADSITSNYMCRLDYINNRISIFTFPEGVEDKSSVSVMTGSTEFFNVFIQSPSNNYIRQGTHALIPRDMTGNIIYLERYLAYGETGIDRDGIYSAGGMLPVPKLMVHDRFVYARAAIQMFGMAKYDRLSKEFIGVPI